MWGHRNPTAAPEFASSTAPEFAFATRNPKGARLPKDDGPSWRNHGESPPPNTTISSDPNRGWGSSGALRHVRESAGPAMVCVKKAAVDPSVSAIRGEKEGPINRRGAARAAPGPWRREIMDNPPNRHCARRPSSRPLLAEEGPPISGAFTAPPRGPRGDENRGKAEELLSAVRARKEALPARRRMAAISPSTPFRIGRRRISGVGNRPPFSAIMGLKSGRAARRRLAATPHRPTEIAGTPRHLTGPFRMDRVDNADFISPSYTHQGAGTSDSWRWCEK